MGSDSWRSVSALPSSPFLSLFSGHDLSHERALEEEENDGKYHTQSKCCSSSIIFISLVIWAKFYFTLVLSWVKTTLWEFLPRVKCIHIKYFNAVVRLLLGNRVPRGHIYIPHKTLLSNRFSKKYSQEINPLNNFKNDFLNALPLAAVASREIML